MDGSVLRPFSNIRQGLRTPNNAIAYNAMLAYTYMYQKLNLIVYMNIDLYSEMKRAIKDALSEWYEENKNSLEQVHSKNEVGDSLLTVKQFCKKHPFISEGGIRSKLYYREFNKFNGCVSRSGRKILIKEKEALEWFSNSPPEAGWTYDENKYKRK